jgi:ISXO2-like transposase domain
MMRCARRRSRLRQQVDGLIKDGYTFVVDADLQAYFDTIPHAALMERVEAKVSDGRVLDLKQKLMEVMRQRNSIYKLSGDVQIDDAYLGGERPAKPGKSGRGAEGKLPFVIAVATRDGRPVHMQLRRVSGFTQEAIQAYAAANIEPGSWVVSDGLNCFPGVKEAGMKHWPIVTGGGRPTHPFFKWVNICLGNLKSAIVGTCRSFDEQHADRYLAAYERRFNRRFDLAKNLERLARVALQTLPKPYRSITALGPAEMTGQSRE